MLQKQFKVQCFVTNAYFTEIFISASFQIEENKYFLKCWKLIDVGVFFIAI